MEKTFMFQYAYNPRWVGVKIVEDTGLITEEEGKKLWEKYLPDFKRQLAEDNRPEMVLWSECTSDHNYVKRFWELDDSYETDGVRFWKNEREYAEFN